MDFVTLMGLIGLPAILSTTIPFLVTRHFQKKDKNQEKLDVNTKRIDEIEKRQENLEIVHKTDTESCGEILSGINDTLIIMRNAQRALLQDRIVQMYNFHYGKQGFMPIYDRDSLTRMYNEYHNLGGNGVVDALVDKMHTLPTNPEK